MKKHNMYFLEDDIVALIKNIPEHGLKTDDVGRVVERVTTFAEPSVIYKVEFFDIHKKLRGVFSVFPEQIKREKIQYFFECYFNQSFDFDQLESVIEKYKTRERSDSVEQLIANLDEVIVSDQYEKVAYYLREYGYRSFKKADHLKKFIQFLYEKLSGNPTNMCGKDFYKIK